MNEYVPSELVKILHAFPHLTFKFVLIKNPVFNLNDQNYLESLVMIALFSLVILGLSMLGFLIYYCCIKLKRASPSKMKSSSCYCSVCLIVVFVMIALGSISVIIYGTIEVHEGIKTTTEKTLKIYNSSFAVNTEIKEIQKSMSKIENAVNDLNQTVSNASDIQVINAFVMSLQLLMQELPFYSTQQGNNLEQLLTFLQSTELYRTIVTYSLIGIQGLICLFALIGICFRSRCLLLTAVFTGLMCLVASYLYIGTALMVDVATADICVQPYTYIERQASELFIDEEVVGYYITCPSNAKNPLMPSISNASTVLWALEKHVALEMDDKNLTDEASAILDTVVLESIDMQNNLENVAGYLDCEPVHSAINLMIPSVCCCNVMRLHCINSSHVRCTTNLEKIFKNKANRRP